ncbi:Amino acid permease-associated region [uncultured Paludibacter sp.]|uniref:Amino acid permease-associated region n=1 Tax=uncultured Paludibacter sp. TaxID=497635 RepID=A0A653AL18_9BACT|nr:Amino acid permease-associated region [uncultured Paludibacter sp.]
MMEDKEKLSLFSLTMIVISLIIGMGIFKTPSFIAAKSGTETIFFTAWIVGGIISLFGALTYAEIGQRLPAIGGYYKIFAHCYHPSVGFTVNILILISNAASMGVVTLIGADYVSDLLYGKPSGALFNVLVASSSILLFYGVNLLGLRTSSRTQNFLMLIKIALVLLLISTVFTGIRVEPHGYNDGIVYNAENHSTAFLLIVSLVAVFFTYGGYQQTVNFGGEIKSAKTMHRGILFGILIVLALYLSINYAYVEVIGYEKMKNANAIGALLFEAWFGKIGAKVFDLAMVLSVLAYVNVILLSNPRVMFAMSEDGMLPKIFSFRNSKTGALVPSLTAYAIIAILITFLGKGVDDVLSLSMFLDCIGMATSASALFILRKRNENNAAVTSGFVTKILPVLTALFVLTYFFVATAVVIDKPFAALTGTVLLALFVAVYFIFHKKNKQTT